MSTGLFGQYTTATLDRCKAVFEERAGQYSDTMKECQWLLMQAIADDLGIDIPPDCFRVLAIAGLVDIKYTRLLGGYKQDTIEDGINYSGFVAEEMRILKQKHTHANPWKPQNQSISPKVE